MKYTFSINLHSLIAPMPIVDTISGEVEADRYSTACIKAWAVIGEKTKESQMRYGVGDLHVEMKSPPCD